MRLTSCHGKVRGGLSEIRNLGAITPLARSVFSRPVVCRNRRNARNELHMSTTFAFERCSPAFSMNLSMSTKADRDQACVVCAVDAEGTVAQCRCPAPACSPQRHCALGDIRNTHSIEEAMPAPRACFSTRAHLHPEIAGRMPRHEWRSAPNRDSSARSASRSAGVRHNSAQSVSAPANDS